MLKNLLKIFGKELYNPIKCKKWNNTIKNHNIINNFNLLNIINNNEIKLENISIKRKREKKSSYSLIK
jgi:Fe-S cluster biosynthesis and repair protein YggX